MVKAMTLMRVAQILVDDRAESGKIITKGLLLCALRNAIELFPDVNFNDEIVNEAQEELFRRYKNRIN